MPPVSNPAPVATGSQNLTQRDRWAIRRHRIARIAVFSGGVLAALAVATPAMAWPAMGC